MTALMVVPFEVNNGNFISSNVPEDDYAGYSEATTYARGDRVITTLRHLVLESVTDGNVGNNPFAPNTGNIPTHWLIVGSTNRWRVFDKSLGQSTTNPDSINFLIGVPSRLDAVALVGLVAVTARVQVTNSLGAETYNQTRELLDVSAIADWLGFFTYSDTFDPEVVFDGINAVAGSTLEITLTTTGGIAEVAEIIAGKAEVLGTILEGTRSGFTDYSRKEVDDFGNITIVKRPTARRAEWELSFPTRANRRIQRALEEARGAPAFFYPGPDMVDFYVSVYGVADDFFPSLQSGGQTQATLSLTGAA
jgi:hypothetical protein